MEGTADSTAYLLFDAVRLKLLPIQPALVGSAMTNARSDTLWMIDQVPLPNTCGIMNRDLLRWIPGDVDDRDRIRDQVVCNYLTVVVMLALRDAAPRLQSPAGAPNEWWTGIDLEFFVEDESIVAFVARFNTDIETGRMRFDTSGELVAAIRLDRETLSVVGLEIR